MRPQRNNAPRCAYFYSFSRQLFRRALAKLFSHFPRRVRPGEFSRISRVGPSLHFPSDSSAVETDPAVRIPTGQLPFGGQGRERQ